MHFTNWITFVSDKISNLNVTMRSLSNQDLFLSLFYYSQYYYIKNKWIIIFIMFQLYIYFNEMKQIYIEQNEKKRLIVSTFYSGPIFLKFYMPFIYIENPGK